MLVRLGVAAIDSVPQGQRVVRSRRPPERPARALPAPRAAAGYAAASAPPEPAYACEEPSTSFDTRRAEQASAAYRAADLVQPRPGLYLHVVA